MGGRERAGTVFESLEQRRLMAGDVIASVYKHALILRGDDAANSIVIQRQADRTTFRLVPMDGTTINGATDPLVVRGVATGMFLDLRGGDDAVTLDNVRVYGTVTIDAGDGNDHVLVRSSRVTDDLILRGGDGRDEIVVRKSTVQRDLHADGGLEKDRFLFSFSHIRNRVSFFDTSGSSLLYMNRFSVDGSSDFRTGNAIDHLTIDGSTFKSSAVFSMNGQDDHATIRGTIFRGEAPLDAGDGENVIDRQVILSWDFRNGEQGWESGFADYDAFSFLPDGKGNLVKVEDVERYELQSGLRPLPAETGVVGSGLFLSGINLSDDLVMYLTRRLMVEDGLVKNQAYTADFTIEFASALRRGLFGGLDYLKAGAASRALERLIIDGSYRLNYDKGNQAQGGTEVSLVGDTTNGAGPSDPGGWRIVTRHHRHTHPVRTDVAGKIWLFVGTESTFESGTAYHYASISVILTPVKAAGHADVVS
ncbi:MAG: hypothetical protein WBD40_23750 [Tepidisphaeraceae bacterium]